VDIPVRPPPICSRLPRGPTWARTPRLDVESLTPFATFTEKNPPTEKSVNNQPAAGRRSFTFTLLDAYPLDVVANEKQAGDALERFETATAWPMLILAVAIIPLLVLPLVVDLTSSQEATATALEWFIWAAFVVEYGVRLALATEKRKFVRQNKIDLLVILLPFLRPLRVVRSARALRVLRAARAAAFLGRSIDALATVLTRHKLHYVLVVTLLAVVGGGALVLEFERSVRGSNIGDLPDALWWAITTVTTVGYGDRFPVSAAGRGVAIVLMVMGIAVFGFLAGSLASFFFEREQEEDIDPQFKEIQDRLDRIENLLAERTKSDS
jgi:voltage-gated potassium channel